MNRLFTYFIVARHGPGRACRMVSITRRLVGWDARPGQSAPAACRSITDLFLRLIKMIIAPLVFATLVAGIAHMEDAAAVGRSAPRPWAGSSAPRRLAAIGLSDGPPAAAGRGPAPGPARAATRPAATTRPSP
jgi:hypothetical protein